METKQLNKKIQIIKPTTRDTTASSVKPDTLPIIVNITGTYYVTDTKYEKILYCDASSGAVIVNLPTGVDNTAMILVKKTDSSSNTVTVNPNGIETIDGSANKVLVAQNESYIFRPFSGGWKLGSFYFNESPKSLVPYSTGLLNLGSASKKWNILYNTQVGNSLIPSADSTYDLGSSGNKWKDLYLSGTTIYLGAGAIRRSTSSGKVEISHDNVTFDAFERHAMTPLYDNLTSGTINFNNGISQRVGVSGNLTFTFSNALTGRAYVLKIEHTLAGSKTFTWPGTVKWPFSAQPAFSTTLNAVDIVTFFYDGTNFYGNGVTGY